MAADAIPVEASSGLVEPGEVCAMRDWLGARIPAIAWGIWGILAAAIAVHAFFFPLVHSVYPIYAPPARAWWMGENLYLFRLDYYRYSPLFAILLTPFAVLPDGLGG